MDANTEPGAELADITEQLGKLAAELEAEPEEERAAELVRDASDLAAKAGEALERALRAASEIRERPA